MTIYFFQCSTEQIASPRRTERGVDQFCSILWNTKPLCCGRENITERACDNETGNALFVLNLGTSVEVDRSSKGMLSLRAGDKELPVQH